MAHPGPSLAVRSRTEHKLAPGAWLLQPFHFCVASDGVRLALAS